MMLGMLVYDSFVGVNQHGQIIADFHNMNTAQIHMALAENAITRTVFWGVFASDQVPNNMGTLPLALVVNKDPTKPPRKPLVHF